MKEENISIESLLNNPKELKSLLKDVVETNNLTENEVNELNSVEVLNKLGLVPFDSKEDTELYLKEYSENLPENQKVKMLEFQNTYYTFKDKNIEKLYNIINQTNNFKWITVSSNVEEEPINFDIHKNGYIGYSTSHKKNFENIIKSRTLINGTVTVREELPFSQEIQNEEGETVKMQFQEVYAYEMMGGKFTPVSKDDLDEFFNTDEETGEYLGEDKFIKFVEKIF